MHKTAWIYPGQGAQKCGMGLDFYENSKIAADFLDAAEEQLDFDLKRICFTENEEINRTAYTQPAMAAVCLAMTKVLLEQGCKPDVTAGLSLGEYAAIAAAGGFEMTDAVKLVRKRGLLMQHIVPEGIGGMCAVLGMETEKIETVLAGRQDVSIANYNCPGQIVITGKLEAIQEAAQALKAAGARRIVPLKVSGPFHSPLMEPAAVELKQAIAKIPLHKLQIPFISNVTAQAVTDTGAISELLCAGIHSPVRWEQSMRYLIANGVDTFVEIGPGRTLSGFLKKIDPSVTVKNISVWEDVEKVINELC